MSSSVPTTRITGEGTVLYECGDDFVPEDEYREYRAAEDAALAHLAAGDVIC